jgi:hypothetical protein
MQGKPASTLAETATVPETVPDSSPNDSNLAEVITAWPMLPEPVKAGILAMVKAVRP